MMISPYDELKTISDAVYARERESWGSDALAVLKQAGIGLRDKDGKLVEMNFSIPEDDCFVLGLRYEKNDGTDTEDHFVFRKGINRVESFYKGKLEKIFTEYKGTHKSARNKERV